MISNVRDAVWLARGAALSLVTRSAIPVIVVAWLACFAGTLVAQPPAATVPDDAVPLASAAQVDDARHSQSEAGQEEDQVVVEPGVRWNGTRWVWGARPQEWGAGVLIGLAAAVWLLLTATGTTSPPALAGPASPGRALARFLFGPGGSSRLPVLMRDPLVWVYIVAAGLVAGFIYSGAFNLLTREIDKVSTLPEVFRWAPTGLISVVGGLFGVGSRYRLAKESFKGEGDAKALRKTVKEVSVPILDLVRARLDRDVRRRILEIAAGYEVGLIQRTMWHKSDHAVDRGRLSPELRAELMAGLLELSPGSEDRDIFLNRIAAVEEATKLVALDELEDVLRKGDRRARVVPVSKELRSGQDRPWRPEPELEQVAA